VALTCQCAYSSPAAASARPPAAASGRQHPAGAALSGRFMDLLCYTFLGLGFVIVHVWASQAACTSQAVQTRELDGWRKGRGKRAVPPLAHPVHPSQGGECGRGSASVWLCFPCSNPPAAPLPDAPCCCCCCPPPCMLAAASSRSAHFSCRSWEGQEGEARRAGVEHTRVDGARVVRVSTFQWHSSMRGGRARGL